MTAPKDNPMPSEPTPAWRVRLNNACECLRVDASVSDVRAALSALDAATARAAKAEVYIEQAANLDDEDKHLAFDAVDKAFHRGRAAGLRIALGYLK